MRSNEDPTIVKIKGRYYIENERAEVVDEIDPSSRTEAAQRG